jgi:hypothetical protein
LDNISILNFFQCYYIFSRWGGRNWISRYIMTLISGVKPHIYNEQTSGNTGHGQPSRNLNRWSRRTRREPPTMGKQLVSFITCGCESSEEIIWFYTFGLVYVTISLYSSPSIIQYRLLSMNQIFNILKLTWLYWFYNVFEDYSICHLNSQCSGDNIYLYNNVVYYFRCWLINHLTHPENIL